MDNIQNQENHNDDNNQSSKLYDLLGNDMDDLQNDEINRVII